MSFQFPPNPQIDDVIVAPNGFTYVWTGAGWETLVVESGGGGVDVSPSAPSEPRDGQLWFDADDNLLKMWLDDAWVAISGSKKGVVDGSVAGAGEVGEVRVSSGFGTMPSTAPANWDPATLTLPPGNWLLGGYWATWGTNNVTSLYVDYSGVTRVPEVPTTWSQPGFQTTAVVTAMTIDAPPVQISITAQTTVGLRVTVTVSAAKTYFAYIIARRIR